MRLFAALFPPDEIVADLLALREKMLSPYSPPPPFAQNRLTREGLLIQPSSAWRPSPREQLHITLQFIGDGISSHQASRIKEALHSIAVPGKSIPQTPDEIDDSQKRPNEPDGASSRSSETADAQKRPNEPDGASSRSKKTGASDSGGPRDSIHSFSIECSGAGAFPDPSRATVIWAGVKSGELARLANAVGVSLAPLGFKPDRPFSGHITILRSKFAQDARALIAPFKDARWSVHPWRADSFCLMDSRVVLGGHEHEEWARYPLHQD